VTDSEDAFLEALEETFNKNSYEGWILLRYSSKSQLQLQATGKSVGELIDKLFDDEVQYMLVRVPITYNNTLGSRDVFIFWIGPNVTTVEKRKEKSSFG